MWPPWSRSSPVQIRTQSRKNTNTPTTTTSSSSSNFGFSSLKDIAAICSEDAADQGPSSPIIRRLPSICHRVVLATSINNNNNILRTRSTPESLFLDSIPESQPPPPPPPQALKPQVSDLSPKRSKLDPTHLPKSQPRVLLLLNESPSPESNKLEQHQPISLPGAETRIVIYYTSLRVVRPTFEACKATLAILQGFRVPIDERDLSMDASFLTELKQILNDKTLTLPRVFIGGRYVGGFEEVRQLHECGELKKMLEGLPVREVGGVCEGCGGFRFVLCRDCSGSRKVYFEKGGFKSCGGCNENGLVRCPNCSFQSPLVLVSS